MCRVGVVELDTSMQVSNTGQQHWDRPEGGGGGTRDEDGWMGELGWWMSVWYNELVN